MCAPPSLPSRPAPAVRGGARRASARLPARPTPAGARLHRLRARSNAAVNACSCERAVCDRVVHARESWSRILPEPIVRCPTSELPICPQATQPLRRMPRAWRAGTAPRARRRPACPRARPRSRTRRNSPPVQDDERDEPQAAPAAARQIASNDATSSDAPPTSAPSTSGRARSTPALSGFTEPP